MITKYKEFLLENKNELSGLMEFIGNNKDVYTYTHTCKTEELCKEILKNGFEFAEFSKTTDLISPLDMITLSYKLMLRKEYGNFILIIQIKKIHKDLESLTIMPPHENENGDEVYTLPRQFIKGYFNKKTLEIVKNPHFNLNYLGQKEYA